MEQYGPWGRTAATESYFPADVGVELTGVCRAAGGRLGLIRRPGEHADPRTGPRLCYLAYSGTQSFLLVGRVETPQDFLGLPLEALAAGDRAAVRAALPQFRPSPPVLLVCTNGRHDVCCAIRGRAQAVPPDDRGSRPGLGVLAYGRAPLLSHRCAPAVGARPGPPRR